ncbi:MAG: hypothetical protein J6U77_02030, partial [Verrucomicrobia bacterium]|nr:hypothetical protein [Verrucomicrobiota bacterium]
RKSNDTTTTGGYALGIQMSEVFLYSSGYERITETTDFIIAVADYATGSNYPAQEPPYASADGDIKIKYLNRGGAKTGFIVTPAVEVTPTAVMYTRANDSEGRDPVNVEIYGTNDPIIDQDNSAGDKENWTLVGEGSFETSAFRFRNSNIIYFTNTDAFTSYKVVFPTLWAGPEMQIGEFYFFDLSAPEPPPPPSEFDYEGDVNYSGSANGSITAGAEEGSYIIKGSGADVWGTNDEFFYAGVEVDDDFDVSVKIDSFTANSNAWAKAGLTVREANADGTIPGNGRHVSAQIQALNQVASSSNDYWTSWRNAVGANVGDGETVHNGSPIVNPSWLRITKVGGIVTTYYAKEEGDWVQQATVDTTEWADGAIGAELPLYVGMWVTSHDGNSNDATAVFTNWTVNTPEPPVSDLELAYAVDGDELVLEWAVSSDAVLEVAPTADSASWTILEGELVGGAWQFRAPMTEAAGYYRLKAE